MGGLDGLGASSTSRLICVDRLDDLIVSVYRVLFSCPVTQLVALMFKEGLPFSSIVGHHNTKNTIVYFGFITASTALLRCSDSSLLVSQLKMRM